MDRRTFNKMLALGGMEFAPGSKSRNLAVSPAPSPAELANPPKTIVLGGNEVTLPENVFTPRYSYMEEGAKVDVLTIGDVIVTIAKKE